MSTITPNEAVVRVLRGAVAQRRISQEDLAKGCHTSRATIANRMSGRVQLRLEDMWSLAVVIGISPSSVLADAESLINESTEQVSA